MGYYPKLSYKDFASNKQRFEAIINILNHVSREMSVGRVPSNKNLLQENIEASEKRVTTPLSIAFVKMVEQGEIDEVTASENANLFISWDEISTYNANDLREYNGKLYKCLLAHTGQADWTPDTATSLWKEVGINENGIAEWSQPISSTDAYMTGDEVMYEGVHYRSLVDNNVWSPTSYPQGWEVLK